MAVSQHELDHRVIRRNVIARYPMSFSPSKTVISPKKYMRAGGEVEHLLALVKVRETPYRRLLTYYGTFLWQRKGRRWKIIGERWTFANDAELARHCAAYRNAFRIMMYAHATGGAIDVSALHPHMHIHTP